VRVPRSDIAAPGESLEELAIAALDRASTWRERHLTEGLTARFGPVTLCVDACGRAMVDVALGAVRHAACSDAVEADLSVIAIDGRETGVQLAPEWMLAAQAHHSAIPRAPDHGVRRLTVALNAPFQTVGVIDGSRRLCVIWIADVASVPSWVIYDQIRNALHWLAHDKSWGLFHAAALRLGQCGCLITGKSGSGKSTITAAAVLDGFETAGDDFVLADTGGTVVRVHAIFDTIKFDERSLERLPAFRNQARHSPCGPEEKAIVHLTDFAPDRIVEGFPLHAILHSRITGEPRSRIVASSSARAFQALAPSTAILLRYREPEIVAKSAVLVKRLPAFAFEIGTDPGEAAGTLRHFMSAFAS
jgi:hypothetical protein